MAEAAAEAAAGSAPAERPPGTLARAWWVMTSFYTVMSFLVGLLLAVPGLLGLMGALPKNDWVGIRMNDVMRDERTWDAGHRAGGPWLVAAGAVAMISGVALLFADPGPGTATRVETLGMVGAFALAAVGAWRAQTAARRVK